TWCWPRATASGISPAMSRSEGGWRTRARPWKRSDAVRAKGVTHGGETRSTHLPGRHGGGDGDVRHAGAGAEQARSHRPAHGEDGAARPGRYPDGTGHDALPEGSQLHAGRPQGRAGCRRHRRQPCRHEDEDPGARRARRRRSHHRSARRLRAARHHRLRRAGDDALVHGFAGSNPWKFMKQYKDQGLTLPALSGSVGCDDALLKSFGDEALGMISCSGYTADLDTPSNKRLVDGMVRDYGNIPGIYAAGIYINGMVAEAALEKTGGKSDDKDALIKALRAVSLTDTPRGPFRFAHLGNVIGNFYIRRTERRGDKLVNTTIKTYPNVSQFWTYDEKWFLSQPVYSRDYPPLKS